jgi:hypothetical protein
MPTLVFSYQIVPSGGAREQSLANGSLYTSSVEAAKKHVQTVSAPDIAGQSNLEVILRDMLGNEICRVPYLGAPKHS